MANMSVVGALLGRHPKRHQRLGTLRGWSLVIQNLEHVPNTKKTHDQVLIQPRSLLRDIWGEKFRSYTIVPSSGGKVTGVIWQDLSEAEHQLILEWELAPWGWFKNVERVDVSGRGLGIFGCRTECIGDGQDYDRMRGFITDDFPEFLMPEEEVVAHARRVGDEFRVRN